MSTGLDRVLRTTRHARRTADDACWTLRLSMMDASVSPCKMVVPRRRHPDPSSGVGSGRMARSSVSAIFACLVAVSVLCLATPSKAAFVNFQNCLSEQIISGDPPPLRLQFDPLNVTATFDLDDPAHTLNITVYGNVSGQADKGVLPPSTDTRYWSNPNNTQGKIVNEDDNTGKSSTLFAKFDVLNYLAFASAGQYFCGALTNNASCPLAPVFGE